MTTTSSNKSSSGRVLACALCKQRRVKCNRQFPCDNCTRSGAECVQPATQQRRRRFAERALLDRINHYEGLLRRHNIAFEPLHPFGIGCPTITITDDNRVHAPNLKSKDGQDIDVWQSIKRQALDDDDDDDDDSDGNSSHYEPPDRQVALAIQGQDHLLFGAPNPQIHLSSVHPSLAQIFRLWQVYLDNVNSLLKVTHAPTLQPRIIDAASNVENISEPLEALMFSIYCAAITSMTEEECLVSFQMTRDDLLSRYQVACRQALLICNPWRNNDRDSLTALYLYLVSIGPQVDPRSLACLIGVAVRIAQRMSLHHESGNNKAGYKPLEVEMRRRLWWSLTLYDHRICEIVSQEKSTSLIPCWDCRPPLNVSDFEIRADMKTPPTRHTTSTTEALFAVVRSELANSIRHTVPHLVMIGGMPLADMLSQPNRREGAELTSLESAIEEKYLSHCNPDEVPLHFMTIWTTRLFFARARLMEHYLLHAATPPDQLPDTQRSKALAHATRMLHCDTQLRTSPKTTGYLWLVESLYSPILAYFHILNGLAKRPAEENADAAWTAVCENYEALMNGPKHHRTRVMFALKFSRIALQTWEAREGLRRGEGGEPETPPRLVVDARERAAAQMSGSPNMGLSAGGNSGSSCSGGEQELVGFDPCFGLDVTGSGSGAMSLGLFSSGLQMGGGGVQGAGMGGQGGFSAAPGMGSTGPFFMSGQQGSLDIMDQFWSDEAFKGI